MKTTKPLFIILLSLMGACMQGKGQVWYPTGNLLKAEVLRQDTVLNQLFAIWQQKDRAIQDVNTIIYLNQLTDSTLKYIGHARYYLDKNKLDSCLLSIHLADEFITASKKKLKMIPQD